MRISDWSSDVCSSDLLGAQCGIILPPFAAFYIEIEIGIEESVERAFHGRLAAGRLVVIVERLHPALARHRRAAGKHRIEQLLLVVEKTGRASCRERVGQDV